MSADETRPFLEVEESVSGRRWQERLDLRGRNLAAAIAEQFEVDQIVARVLAGRDVALEEVEGFLNPTLRDLMPDPSTLTDMDKAARRLADAVVAGEEVAIFGDYPE